MNRRLTVSMAVSRRQKREEKTFPLLSAQPIEKSRFGRENPRKSKEFQPPKSGVFAAKRRGLKKTQIEPAGPKVAAAAEEEQNRLYPGCHAAKISLLATVESVFSR
jgi:hypothetical protein